MEHVNTEANVRRLFSQDFVAHAVLTWERLFVAITSMRDGNGAQGPRDSSERVSVLTLNFVWLQGLSEVPW